MSLAMTRSISLSAPRDVFSGCAAGMLGPPPVPRDFIASPRGQVSCEIFCCPRIPFELTKSIPRLIVQPFPACMQVLWLLLTPAGPAAPLSTGYQGYPGQPAGLLE